MGVMENSGHDAFPGWMWMLSMWMLVLRLGSRSGSFFLRLVSGAERRLSVCPGSGAGPGASVARSALFPGAMLAALLLGASSSAVSAAPILYTVTGGSAQISVMVGGVLVGQTTSPGLSGTLTLDSSAHSVDSVNLILDPNLQLMLSAPYGGYDEITIEVASLSSAPGFGALSSPTVGSSSYTAVVGPLRVNGFWGATDSSGTNPVVSGMAIGYDVSSLTAVVHDGPAVAIDGVTLNTLNGVHYGEASDLTVLASFSVTALATPEPSSGLLAGWGLAMLAAARRRSKVRA